MATQDDNLRKVHFIGLPEMVMNYFRFLARETREWLAVLGVRSMAELIGRTDLLEIMEGQTAKQSRLDLSPILSDGGVAKDKPQGSALMRRAEARLARMGCPKLNLQVRATAPEAVGFYERLGFQVEERISMGKVLPPGAPLM